jgi:hypothetical protein
MTHNDLILQHLEQGRTITAIEALVLFGCFRLAARIKELRDAGHNIVTYRGRPGSRAIASYRLYEDHA